MQIKKTILTESVTLEELRKIIREGRAAQSWLSMQYQLLK